MCLGELRWALACILDLQNLVQAIQARDSGLIGYNDIIIGMHEMQNLRLDGYGDTVFENSGTLYQRKKRHGFE